MTLSLADALPETVPDRPCRFKKVLVRGLTPAASEVDALMASLEARSASHRSREEAERQPQAVAGSDALADVLAFRSRRK
ncbi:MAG TPA: hypothetical protein VF395_06205 [Polyangiaceae bacterium]